MTKFLKLLLALLFILQLLVAGGFGLAHDEAYYWLFSRHLDWGYFDHPPFMAVVIRIFSFLPHSELGVRFGFILLQFLTLGILLKLIDKRFHKTATILFFAFPLASLTGLLALPDIPLLFMTAVYCLLLRQFLEKRDYASGLGLGVAIAALLNAKYHGILLVFFTMVALPGLFREKKFYFVALIAILCFLPHVWWQYMHDFATLRYHFLERPSSEFSWKRMLEYLGTQVGLAGLFVGPIVWWNALREPAKSDFDRSMKAICFGTVMFFLISTWSKKFEANWTIFLTVPLIYLVAGSGVWERRMPKFLLSLSFVTVVVARLAFLFPAGTMGLKRLNEFKGWEKWALEVREKCKGTLVANTYQVAGKLSFYLKDEIHSVNYHSRKNQFDVWRWDLEKPMKDVCYLTNSPEFDGAPVLTPEGKELRLVTNIPYEDLLKRKSETVR